MIFVADENIDTDIIDILRKNGVILLRIFGISQKQKARMILDVFKNHLTEFSGCFTVINKNKVRVKKMN